MAQTAALFDAGITIAGGTGIGRVNGVRLSVGGAANAIDSSVSAAWIFGGTAAQPNVIGSTGKPVGTAFTPTDWADDSAYVAGFAQIATIGGGYDNFNNQEAGTLSGGGHNFIKYNADGHSFLGGGSYNLISAARSAIVGGRRSTITGASSAFSFIGAGDDLNISASYSAIIGGLDCDISANYSLAFGRRAKVTSSGSVAFTDSTDADFTNSTANSFAARYSGGFRFDVGSSNAATISSSGVIGVTRSATTGQPEFYSATASGGETLSIRYVEVATSAIPVDVWQIRVGGSARNILFSQFDSIPMMQVGATGTTFYRTENDTASRRHFGFVRGDATGNGAFINSSGDASNGIAEVTFEVGASNRMRLRADGSVLLGTLSALSTTATAGFAYVRGGPGTPTGTPDSYTGLSAIYIDQTNHKFYFYSGGAWRDAGP